MHEFDTISLVGRIAYGIMCAEEYLLHKYPNKNWEMVFEVFWEITSLELWEDWIDEAIEIIPEYLFEFKDYASSKFDCLTEEKYEALKKLYEGTNDDVSKILKMVYQLANSHAYSSIRGNGVESLQCLDKIINFLQEEGIALPDKTPVEACLFSERDGWGNRFDGACVSKIIKK